MYSLLFVGLTIQLLYYSYDQHTTQDILLTQDNTILLVSASLMLIGFLFVLK